jgi:hypothetical protein
MRDIMQPIFKAATFYVKTLHNFPFLTLPKKQVVTILKQFHFAFSIGFHLASDVLSYINFVIHGSMKITPLIFVSLILGNL